MEITLNAHTLKAAKAYAAADGKKSVSEWALAINYALDRAETITTNEGEMPRGWNKAWTETYAGKVSGAARLDQFGSKGWAIVCHFAGQVFEDGFDRADIGSLAQVMATEFGGLSSAYSKLPKEDGEKGEKSPKSPLELLIVAARRAKDQGLSQADFLALAAEAFGG